MTALDNKVSGKSYTIELNDLYCGDNKLNKNQINVFNGHYINVEANWQGDQYDAWYPNGIDTLNTGWYVDALVPFAAAQYNNENVFNLTNGNNQTLYLDFAIPSSQPAGTYTGTFKVRFENNGYLDIPVSYTVYDFELPEENNAKLDFEINTNILKNMYGVSSASFNSDLYEELYNYLLEYNVGGGYLPQSVYHGELEWDAYLQTVINYANNPNLSLFALDIDYSKVNYEYKLKSSSSKVSYTNLCVINENDGHITTKSGTYTLYGIKTRLLKIAQYAVANNINLFEKMYVRLPQNDEPTTDKAYIEAILSYNSVRRSIDYVLANVDFTGHDDIKESLMNIPYIITSEPCDELYQGNKLVDSVYYQKATVVSSEVFDEEEITITYKYCTDYCPLFVYFSNNTKTSTSYSRLMTMLEDSDYTIWWYGCCQPVNPYQNYDVNSNQVITRANRWLQFLLGVDAELYYAVNEWRNNIYNSSTKEFTVEGEDAWIDEDDVWAGLSATASAYGDGVLIYPNVTRYSSYNAATGDYFKFVATYRLYVIRESIDDYNYLCYCTKLIDSLADGSKKTNALNSLNNILNNLYTTSDAKTESIINDAETLRNLRTQLIQLITSLQ